MGRGKPRHVTQVNELVGSLPVLTRRLYDMYSETFISLDRLEQAQVNSISELSIWVMQADLPEFAFFVKTELALMLTIWSLAPQSIIHARKIVRNMLDMASGT